MRLATRTGLAAFAAASISVLIVGLALQVLYTRALVQRSDALLEERARSAPVLAAVGDRIGRSELRSTLPTTRIVTDDATVTLGTFPANQLPLPTEPGWETVRVRGQRWRLHTVEVVDVPDAGDRALVQMASPLGRVDAQARQLRRWAWLLGLIAAGGAGAVGYAFGGVASRPITALRRDTARLDDAHPERWRVGDHYGSPDVDDVAGTLNDTLVRLASETKRRGEALEAARAFASSASHELRVPLQGALTNLNMAGTGRLPQDEQAEVIESAAQQVTRMSDALTAVRALAEAEFADPSSFGPADLAEIVETAVAAETDHAPGVVATVDVAPAVAGPRRPSGHLWPEGVALAVANVVRNSAVHGGPADGRQTVIAVQIDEPTVTVDDNGPGIPDADRNRLIERFERGGAAAGSGLGLAIARQVVVAHGGSIELAESPLGGLRVRLRFAPPHPERSPAPIGALPRPPGAGDLNDAGR